MKILVLYHDSSFSLVFTPPFPIPDEGKKLTQISAMGIGGGIRQCRRKCRLMLVLRRQKNAVVKVFTYAVFLFRFYNVVDNS